MGTGTRVWAGGGVVEGTGAQKDSEKGERQRKWWLSRFEVVYIPSGCYGIGCWHGMGTFLRSPCHGECILVTITGNTFK